MKTLFDTAVADMKEHAVAVQSQTQTEQLLSWFEKGGTITSFEAYLKFGITQLGRCIDDLQKQGLHFDKPRERTENGKIVVRYKLIKGS